MSLDPSIPPIDEALLPADVRAGGRKAEQLYSVALQFESLLVDQLTTQLAQSSGMGGGLDGSSDSGDGSDDGTNTSPYAALLPGALSQAVTAGGGLGLAQEIYTSLSQRQQGTS